MSKLTDFFSGSMSKVIDSVGTAVDKLVTSDEERLTVKAQIAKDLTQFKTQQLKALADYDQQITQRHAHDMQSDSWLSKNIRPLSLAFLTIATVILAYLCIFVLPISRVQVIAPWVDLLKILLLTAYSFYFGSRTIEKVKRKKD